MSVNGPGRPLRTGSDSVCQALLRPFRLDSVHGLVIEEPSAARTALAMW